MPFHSLLLEHILYCFFYGQVSLNRVSFYVLCFKSPVTLKKDSRPSSFGEKWGLPFNHWAWPFGTLAVQRLGWTEGNQPVLVKEGLRQNICLITSACDLSPLPISSASVHQDKPSRVLFICQSPQPTFCRAELSSHPASHLLGNYWVPIIEIRPAVFWVVRPKKRCVQVTQASLVLCMELVHGGR